ncbi:MAG: PadR family transcriptional regulator [Erysipelotrichaceae bacterium]|jgi:PadR family transcriptional regulator PadR|nr:PadR family transcriptional regulator [Erysipelotrichaceae bacterium]
MKALLNEIQDCCILSILKRGDAYGYQIGQEIKELFDISESTLYPILRRLLKERFLTVREEEVDGRKRRYYHLTTLGEMHLESLQESWESFSESVNSFLVKAGNTS